MYDYYDGDYDDEDAVYLAIGKCACDSEWFEFVVPGGVAVFTIDDLGVPIDANGHPRCVECGLDYPIVFEDYVTGEIEVFLSGDMDVSDEDD